VFEKDADGKYLQRTILLRCDTPEIRDKLLKERHVFRCLLCSEGASAGLGEGERGREGSREQKERYSFGCVFLSVPSV
jgi:hypothetical protein